MKLVDCHAHLTSDSVNNAEEVIARAKESGVEKIICSASDLSSSREAVFLAEKYENVFANVGIHPENTYDLPKDWVDLLESLASHPKCVAIGEIGLDYHSEGFDKTKQFEVFEKQLALAEKCNLPVVIHCRNAIGDAIEILQKRTLLPSLFHCFGGSEESAKQLLKMGFSFSIGGVVTFKNAKNLPDVVKMLPKDRILLETDSPYLCPEPFRGQKNESKNVIYIADQIAKIRGETLEEVARYTTENAERLFLI